MRRLLWVLLTGIAFACGPPNYACSSTSTSNAGTVSPIFSATSPTATTCSGMCQNSVAYDTSLNPIGLDPISRLSDGTTFPSGASVGNITCSGGDNDLQSSANETYLGLTQGGFARIFHMSVAPDGSYRVANSGGTPGISLLCPIAFDRTADNVFYRLISLTQIWKYTITSDTTTTSTELYDITGASGFQQCPGVNWSTFGTPTSGSIFGLKSDGTRFGFVVAPGAQGTGDWVFVVDTTLGTNGGCKSINFNTGQYWAFCTVSCSSSTTAAGTLSSGCYGSQGGITKGIHDMEMSEDGNTLVVTVNAGGGWTGGACNGQTYSVQFSIYNLTSDTDIWAYNNTGAVGGVCCMGAHESVGFTHTLTPYFNGPDIVLNSNPATQTQFAAATVQADVHASWPHPLGDDSYPWIFANDLQPDSANSGCTNHAQCPTYPQNLIGAWFPGTSYPPGKTPVIFAHTFSCNNGGATATCAASVHDAYFGGQQSIGMVTSKGHFFVWASTHLASLGNDNLGNPREDAFAVALDGGTFLASGSLQNGSSLLNGARIQ